MQHGGVERASLRLLPVADATETSRPPIIAGFPGFELAIHH